MTKYNIEHEEFEGSWEEAKNAIHVGMYTNFYSKMRRDREEKSKLRFFLEGKTDWGPEKPAEYMKKLTRKQASTIFKARTRMIKVKGNYKNGYPDQACRACQKYPESQIHVMYECKTLHPETPTSDNDQPSIQIKTCNLTKNTETRPPDTNKPDNLSHPCDIQRSTQINEQPETQSDPNYGTNTETETMTHDNDQMDIFNEDPETLKTLAKRIDGTLDELMRYDK